MPALSNNSAPELTVTQVPTSSIQDIDCPEIEPCLSIEHAPNSKVALLSRHAIVGQCTQMGVSAHSIFNLTESISFCPVVQCNMRFNITSNSTSLFATAPSVTNMFSDFVRMQNSLYNNLSDYQHQTFTIGDEDEIEMNDDVSFYKFIKAAHINKFNIYLISFKNGYANRLSIAPAFESTVAHYLKSPTEDIDFPGMKPSLPIEHAPQSELALLSVPTTVVQCTQMEVVLYEVNSFICYCYCYTVNSRGLMQAANARMSLWS